MTVREKINNEKANFFLFQGNDDTILDFENPVVFKTLQSLNREFEENFSSFEEAGEILKHRTLDVDICSDGLIIW